MMHETSGIGEGKFSDRQSQISENFGSHFISTVAAVKSPSKAPTHSHRSQIFQEDERVDSTRSGLGITSARRNKSVQHNRWIKKRPFLLNSW